MVDATTALLSGETLADELPAIWPPVNSIAAWERYQADAKAAIEGTSTTVERIVEAVALGKATLTTVDVVMSMQYRSALRAILSEPQPATIPTDLPTKLAYPANT